LSYSSQFIRLPPETLLAGQGIRINNMEISKPLLSGLLKKENSTKKEMKNFKEAIETSPGVM
jgi:NAD(P)H-dependent FMN reductase